VDPARCAGMRRPIMMMTAAKRAGTVPAQITRTRTATNPAAAPR
jgi:hypothetical protein